MCWCECAQLGVTQPILSPSGISDAPQPHTTDEGKAQPPFAALYICHVRATAAAVAAAAIVRS